jgi:hypothetical protein
MRFRLPAAFMSTRASTVTLVVVLAAAMAPLSLASATASVNPATEQSSAVDTADASYAQQEADWIISAQVVSAGPAAGAIAETPPPYGAPISSYAGELCVLPDRANDAIPGLVAAGPQYYGAALAWLNWYLANLEWPDPSGLYGTVSDYLVDPATGTEVYSDANCSRSASPYYDSSDGYASSFIVAVMAFVSADPADGDAWVSEHGAQLDAIGEVMLATQQPNGLVGAKPTSLGEYLQDNVGDVEGLQALAWLHQQVLGDPAGATVWASHATALQSAIEQYLWMPCAAQQMYCWAADKLTPEASYGRAGHSSSPTGTPKRSRSPKATFLLPETRHCGRASINNSRLGRTAALPLQIRAIRATRIRTWRSPR